MERLTYRGENGKPYVRADGYYQHCRINLDSVAEHLAAYEDAEEKGSLVRLPCRVGDTVYRVTKSGAIFDELVDDIAMPEFYTETQDGFLGLVSFGEFGDTVFLTREKAEDALAKER